MGENGDEVSSKSGSGCDTSELELEEAAVDNKDGDDETRGSVGVPGRDGHDSMAPHATHTSSENVG